MSTSLAGGASATAGINGLASNVTNGTVHPNVSSLHGDSFCGQLCSVSEAYTSAHRSHTRCQLNSNELPVLGKSFEIASALVRLLYAAACQLTQVHVLLGA
jgi:hypothetical protein